MRDSGYWRTWKLAQRLERGTRTPLDYIVKVNRYLQQGFSYSERPTPVRRGVEPLDGFLFDTKEGYCQHFAGAMALLLRMGGVPSRVATGFSPGGYSSRYHAWIVRDTDAHAWVEAWFDGTGWVTYDPTPLATPARSQIAALTEPPPGTDTPATPVAGGARGGAAVSSHHGLRPDLTIDLQRHDAAATHGRLAAGGGMPWWGWVLLALPLLGVVAALVVLVRRARMFASLPPVERAIAELEAALRRAGRPAPVGTTLRQLEGRLGNSPEANEYLRALSAARYGEAPLPTPNQRRAMRRALAEGLGFSGVLRAWWALPPRAPSR
jgi:hypothetical protein